MINLLLLSIENVVFLEYLSILSKLFELYIYPVRYLTTEFIRFVKKYGFYAFVLQIEQQTVKSGFLIASIGIE